ncbi:MAG TPA: cytochrome c oxidase assembly protein [Acidimicrobiales bacterium]|nr:cytochrome c oxidase assembly protein [Acidimicrobiales bacterium]
MLADAVSPPVHLHRLLTGWQLGGWTTLLALALQLLAAAAYLWGVVRLRRRGRRWAPTRTVPFLGGLVVLFIAVESGLASYEESLFGAHVVQHIALMMIAPPLLSLGAPITLALQAASPAGQRRLLRVLNSPPVSLLTNPLVVGGLYYASMWIDLQSSFYPFSLDHPLAHDASHLVMFTIGCLFWWPLVAVDRLPHRPGYPVRLALLVVGMPFEAFLGIALMSTHDSVAVQHTLSDTHAGGAIFWVGAMTVMFVTAIVIGIGWMHQEERAGLRADRLADAPAGANQSGTEARRQELWSAEWARRTGRVPKFDSALTGAGAPEGEGGGRA